MALFEPPSTPDRRRADFDQLPLTRRPPVHHGRRTRDFPVDIDDSDGWLKQWYAGIDRSVLVLLVAVAIGPFVLGNVGAWMGAVHGRNLDARTVSFAWYQLWTYEEQYALLGMTAGAFIGRYLSGFLCLYLFRFPEVARTLILLFVADAFALVGLVVVATFAPILALTLSVIAFLAIPVFVRCVVIDRVIQPVR